MAKEMNECVNGFPVGVDGNTDGAAAAKVAFLVGGVIGMIGSCVVVITLAGLSNVDSAFTTGQVAVALGFSFVVTLWAAAELGFAVFDNFGKKMRYEVIPAEDDNEDAPSDKKPVGIFFPWLTREHLAGLRAGAEFVAIMAYVYLCDRTDVFGKSKKLRSLHSVKVDGKWKQDPVDVTRSKDYFWSVNLLTLLVALYTLKKSHNNPESKPLQRDQTEEWKGWMQLMFIYYHYFEASETYNAIRIYIAAYVWMTGFGNFSYYYIKRDFSTVRFAQMMWRLNFLVFFMCVVMNNEYMLYYICPMHTLFTLFVYFMLGSFRHLNDSPSAVWCKIGSLFVVAFVLWDIPGVFDIVFYPTKWLTAFHDPLHPEFPEMHEWGFRSGLDHYVWAVGMVCAMSFPCTSKWLMKIDELPTYSRHVARLALLGVVLFLGYLWTVNIFLLPKKGYNALHPYTSWIPLVLYMVLRNIHPILRQYYMHGLGFTGKITLETYILQFHVWMKTTGLNGSPKFLMVWFEDYYFLNFIVISVVYFFVSNRLFYVTVALRDVAIPKEEDRLVGALVKMAIVVCVFWASGFLVKSTLM